MSVSDCSFLRRTQRASQKKPTNNANADVHKNLTPQHVDVDRSQWVAVAPSLLDGLPYCKEPEADCEACCYCSKLVVRDGC